MRIAGYLLVGTALIWLGAATPAGGDAFAFAGACFYIGAAAEAWCR